MTPAGRTPRIDRRYRVMNPHGDVRLVCLMPGLWWDDRRQYEMKRVRRYGQGPPWEVRVRRTHKPLGSVERLQQAAELVHERRVGEFKAWMEAR